MKKTSPAPVLPLPAFGPALALAFSLALGICVCPSPAFSAVPAVPADHAARMQRSIALFQSDVRLLLRKNCAECHGGKKVRSGLNLITREGLLEGGENGPAVIPGDSAGSRLVALIEHREEPFMPKDADDKLSDSEIATIAEWIDLGAAYDKPLLDPAEAAAAAADGPMIVTDDDRRFWSFKPLGEYAPPEPREPGRAISPIDRFIAAGLEEHGLAPNPEAHPRTLIRRMAFDLTGLPPAPEAVDSFVQAYEAARARDAETENRRAGVRETAKWRNGETVSRIDSADSPIRSRDRGTDSTEGASEAREVIAATIDRLLGSPHFGEKWARHWLDVARFAESHGFEQDYDRPYAYHYRDFVIRAFNQDMPFDQFTRWQLAGDELAPGDPLALMATGFLGAGAFPTQLTEKEFESSRYDELDDMAGTMGTAFLGLTTGCARCHDHKYDPIPTRDYYRLAATFTTAIRSEIDVELDPGRYRDEKAAWDGAHAPIAAALEDYQSNHLDRAFDAWLSSAQESDSGPPDRPWRVLDIQKFQSKAGAGFQRLDDGSLLITGENSQVDDFTVTARVDSRDITSLRVEALTHPSLRKHGPGRARNGNFSLTDLGVSIRPLRDPKAKLAPVDLVNPSATHEQNDKSLSARAVVDDSPSATGWAVDQGGIGKDQALVIDFEEPVAGFDGGTELSVSLRFGLNVQHSIGRLRLSVSAEADPPVVVGDDFPERATTAFAALTSAGADSLGESDREALRQWFRESDPEWRALDRAVRDHRNREPQPSLVKVQITSEGIAPMKHHADDRGFPHFYPQTYFLSRGDVSQKSGEAAPGFLQVLMRDGKTESTWSAQPPEGASTSFRRAALADWITDTEHGAGHLLARVIVNRLWHQYFGRGLVSTPSDFGFQGDRPTHPELLDYLAAELIRNGWRLKPLHRMILLSATYRQSSAPDAAMAKIDPENRFLWRFSPRRLQAELIRDSLLAVGGVLDDEMFGPGTLDEGNARRSVYLMIKRSQLIPMMQVFDAPEPLVSQGSRPSTTVAPQALTFMNNSSVRGWVDAFARRIDRASPHSLESALVEGYRIALGRPPSPAEQQAAIAFLENQLVDYKHEGRTDARLLALGDFCQVLVSLNEFCYLE